MKKVIRVISLIMIVLCFVGCSKDNKRVTDSAQGNLRERYAERFCAQ